jgi:hypothetical protein
MRPTATPFLVSFLIGFPAAALAGTAQDDMTRVIARLHLEPSKAEAHARCVREVPASEARLGDPVIDRYCVLRNGAPRKVGLFVGVRLAAELEQAGLAEQSRIVDALVDAQEAGAEVATASR